ncbi:MAG: PadR family transcriptional regulator [Actinobacteria bacterium]|nr:PadR family transcriptional regulator [Actinomycetota bacterium]MBU1493078.1 PadR family transcriptional regulator [Actinomycetota bacterium]
MRLPWKARRGGAIPVEERRSLGEWAVLGLLAEEPAHPFALARLLGSGGPLGRVLTVRRPLVYRAVDRLADDGLVVAERTEPGEAGPERTVYRITVAGQCDLDAWLGTPVAHIRDLRLGFLLKVALLRRSGRPTAPLVRAQREALSGALASLATLPNDPDDADLWRHHNAAAAAAFLEDLAGRA